MENRTTLIPPEARQALKTPRAAAIAGIAFSVLLGASLLIIRIALPTTPHEAGPWLTDPALKNVALFALTLVPFAGIAFLWFIGVVRDRMGAREDRFFATVFLGSGLLFVALLFVDAVVAAGLLSVESVNSDVWRFGHSLIALLTSYALKMAAVFMISTATITLRTAFMPRWLGWLGYAIAAVLLLGAGLAPWVELLFPLWTLLVSVHLLVVTLPAPTD